MAETLSLIFAMLCCTAILSIDLRAIRRSLEQREQLFDDSAEGRP